MYYLITWQDWKGKEMSLRLDPKDVVKFVAILVSSIKPGKFEVRLID
jgi:hypothetical protein